MPVSIAHARKLSLLPAEPLVERAKIMAARSLATAPSPCYDRAIE
jgi:hypothetical protein